MSDDKRLFTPGPLTTSLSVKQAMLRDLGSRDGEFVDLVRGVRQRLQEIAGLGPEDGWESVIVQGSGTYGLEAVVSSLVPGSGGLLVLQNGAYGKRLVALGRRHGLRTEVLACAEDTPIDPAAVEARLSQDGGLTHVALVHCETTTGLMNPVEAVGRVVQRHGRTMLLDSMSAFGATPLDLRTAGVDVLVSSSNKCIEGVPGFAFVLARRRLLEAAEGQARTLSLDLCAQWRGLQADGMFRFTPPTHALLAFAQALDELAQEGGPTARARRYADNQRVLIRGLSALGFRSYLRPQVQGPIITTFHYPQHAAFRFDEFYRRLGARGFVIYPGKLSEAACFRIGSIGRLDGDDMRALVAAVAAVLAEMGVPSGA